MDRGGQRPALERPYTELTYLPMLEVMKYLRANGYKTYIVTGGGQDFVRAYSEEVYGIPPEQVIGTAGATRTATTRTARPFLTKEPKLLLNDNNAGKPEGIHLMIGRRPHAAFGNRPATSRCWSTRGRRRRRLLMLSSTMTPSASTPMARRKGFPTPRSGRSPRRSTTKRRRKDGS